MLPEFWLVVVGAAPGVPIDDGAAEGDGLIATDVETEAGAVPDPPAAADS